MAKPKRVVKLRLAPALPGVQHGTVIVPADVSWLGQASKRKRYLVAVSGGADSVALLQLLLEAGFSKLIVCHLDHRLRGRASAGDARFVRGLANKLGLVCDIGRLDVAQRMQTESQSMETAARHARHEFFATCAARHRCPRVLLAHHAEDQAETILWNLLRGSRGAKGMADEQSIQVGRRKLILVRPLLGIRKAELVEGLRARGLKWREDASNAQAVAVRNRLRHEVMPLLAEIGGRDAVEPWLRLAGDFEQWRACERELLAAVKLRDPQGRLHLPTLSKLPSLLRRAALRDYLLDQGVNGVDRALLERADAMLDVSAAAVINLPGERRLRRRGGRVWVEAGSPPAPRRGPS